MLGLAQSSAIQQDCIPRVLAAPVPKPMSTGMPESGSPHHNALSFAASPHLSTEVCRVKNARASFPRRGASAEKKERSTLSLLELVHLGACLTVMLRVPYATLHRPPAAWPLAT